jgi:hypothetical protein
MTGLKVPACGLAASVKVRNTTAGWHTPNLDALLSKAESMRYTLLRAEHMLKTRPSAANGMARNAQWLAREAGTCTTEDCEPG